MLISLAIVVGLAFSSGNVCLDWCAFAFGGFVDLVINLLRVGFGFDSVFVCLCLL